jgi:hypothetical protein
MTTANSLIQPFAGLGRFQYFQQMLATLQRFVMGQKHKQVILYGHFSLFVDDCCDTTIFVARTRGSVDNNKRWGKNSASVWTFF